MLALCITGLRTDAGRPHQTIDTIHATPFTELAQIIADLAIAVYGTAFKPYENLSPDQKQYFKRFRVCSKLVAIQAKTADADSSPYSAADFEQMGAPTADTQGSYRTGGDT